MSRRAACLVLLLCACSKASEEQDSARLSPGLAPPPGDSLPAELEIPVLIDGVAAAPVTSARLAALKPDFVDAERRAWKLARLVPGPTIGGTVDAVSREGVTISMPWPRSAGDLEPVLFVTRRGDVVATLVDPARPFPEFHGQGGRLRRPGDTTPRVTPVVRLELRSAAAALRPGP